ncbi:MAG: nucleotide pyrophosphohydrolase [archaeon]|nr:nucleotide pyrophosphohydrolase [archaeon]
MNDNETTISELKKNMQNFVQNRDWEKYHKPKDLAIAISTEASELLELFLFKNPSLPEILLDSKIRTAVKEEIADIFAYLLSIVNILDIDLSESYSNKMKKNELKYPTSKFNGNYEKISKKK